MAAGKHIDAITEFGDFQTPPDLARLVCERIARTEFAPATIVEPTCGLGNILLAATRRFPTFRLAIGSDINASYIASAEATFAGESPSLPGRVTLHCEDFFKANWTERLSELPEPILVVGNPPWVTNSALGSLQSENLPRKSNLHQHVGIEAITGKSNFDISEWMMLRLLELLRGRDACLAVLCKTAVARKVLTYAWRHSFDLRSASVFKIDATRHFNAAVDAALLVCWIGKEHGARSCAVYDTLEANSPSSEFGYCDDELVANVELYLRSKALVGKERRKWRSGVKHDCAGVMELRQTTERLVNGLGESVDIEPDFVYPLAKGTEIARSRFETSQRYVIVTQRAIGEETASLADAAPKTWNYLIQHGALLDRRASSIYRNRPRFSVFGVGEYTFAPWKVAISGFQKDLTFRIVGPRDGRPVVFDDTVNFLPCHSDEEAQFIVSLLQTDRVQNFYKSLVFWESKRPLTIDLLKRLDLLAAAREVGQEDRFHKYFERTSTTTRKVSQRQTQLFPDF